MKSLLIFIIAFLFSTLIYGQYNLNWHAGACTNIDFRSGSMQLFLTPDTTPFFGSNTSLSKKDSSFACFTNGTTIFRADGSKMPNGDSLAFTHFQQMNYPLGLLFSQGCIFLNKPGSDSIIYLFHQSIDNDTIDYYSNVIYLTTINLSGDSGRGTVVSKNVHAFDTVDSLMKGKLKAVKHANGRDWWLISKYLNKNEFLEWLITPDTITGPYHKTFLGNTGLDGFYDQAVVSEDGSKYAITFWADMTTQLFDFDRCTGDFNLIFNENMNDSTNPGGGVAFSKSGRYLYITTTLHCWQLDMNASNIFASRVNIATYDGYTDNGFACYLNFASLAPDEKIYISGEGGTTNHWARINNPELSDTMAHVEQHVVSLFCYDVGAFPNLPNFNLGPVAMSVCDTILGIHENTTNKLNLIPNPVNTTFKLTGNLFYPIDYSVYDLIGREIIFNMTSTSEIDVNKLKKGLYLLKVKDRNDNIYNLKFVKE